MALPARRFARCCLAVLLAAIAARERPLAAQQMLVASQNTLHYGWGTTNPSRAQGSAVVPGTGAYKTAQILSILPNVTAPGVLMLQEVMTLTDVGAMAAACPPGPCAPYQSPAYGRGWYLETYLFLVSDPLGALSVNGLGVSCGPGVGGKACSNFSRPPVWLSVTPTGAGGPGPLFLVDFHAVWGRSAAARQAEAKAMPAVVKLIKGSNAIVVGGDWNLDVPTLQPLLSAAANSLAPTALTSLNPAGQQSSSYDHFWFNKGGGYNFGAPLLWPCNPATAGSAASAAACSARLVTWRQNVSDHLGIYVTADW